MSAFDDLIPQSGTFDDLVPKAAGTFADLTPASENLPDTLKVAGFDTGIPLRKELAAYLTTMGGRMASSYRGVKQLFGLDKGEEAENERRLRALEADPEVGGYAKAGGFIGAGLDPLVLALPVAKAKTLLESAKYGAISGAGIGLISPVAEGESRAVNAATTAAAGGIMAPALSALASRGKMPLYRQPAEVIPREPLLRLEYKPTPREPLIVNAAGEVGDEATMFTRSYAHQSADLPSFYEVKPQGIGLSSTQEATKDLVRAARPRVPDNANPAEVPIRDLIAQRRLQGGAINPNLAAQIGGAGAGAVTGAVTADEDAPPSEIAARALLGGAAGWQLAKFGANRIGAVKAPIAQAGKVARETVNVIGDAAEPLFKQEVAPETTKRIASLAKEFFTANPGLRDPTRLISDDIQRYVAGVAVPQETLAAHNLNMGQFADVWRASISDHARSLGYLSQVMRDAVKHMSPEELGALRAGGELAPSDYVRPFWKKLTDAWRALLVTQPATAVRNAITQAGRVGLDVMQAPMDNWVQRLTGRPVTVQPLDGLEELFALFQRNKASTDKILTAFPSEKRRLFQNYLSDVSANVEQTDKVWKGIETGTHAANILNRSQEYLFRRAIFQTSLDHLLRNRGLDLKDIIANNRLGEIPQDAVRASVQTALNRTFGETPAWGTMSRKLIDAVNAIPGANLAIPFPRFLVNAIKFQYEYSPFGVLSFLSKAERDAFVQGNVAKASKAVIGSAMFGAAAMFRNSEYAGEKWYEAVDSKGKVYDLRPFNPFASYLFAADVLKKQKDGTLYKLTGSDVAQGLLSSNMRAGTGLYLLDSAINLISQSSDEKKLATKGAEFAGDFLSGFFTPLNVLRDAYDQITEGQAIVRDTRQEFLGPIKSRLPGVSQSLPEAEFATREGPKVYEDPLLRQVTGVSQSGPKTSVEKELDRLGFERREVLPATGDKETDREYTRAMGIASERVLNPLVESEGYQGLSDAMKGLVLSTAIEEARQSVREAVNEELPVEKRSQLEMRRQPPRLRYLLRELGVER